MIASAIVYQSLHSFPGDFRAGVTRINAIANAVADWAARNGFRLNLAETKGIILSSTPNLAQLCELNIQPITVDSKIVPCVNTVENLGIYISADLSRNKNVAQVARKMYATLAE